MIQCPECGKWFKSKKALAGHRRTCKPKKDDSENLKTIEDLKQTIQDLNGVIEQLIEEADAYQTATKKRIQELEAQYKT